MNLYIKKNRDIIKANLKAEEENKQMKEAFQIKYKKAEELFIEALKHYYVNACQCAYQRFQQLIGIDCCKSGDSFKCYDTDLLISLSKEYFDIQKSELSDENKNEKWVCKKCGSTYEFGWSDFSIYVERQKLKLVILQVKEIGSPASKPIPVYLGLMGHTYPLESEIINVDFEEFKNYLGLDE